MGSNYIAIYLNGEKVGWKFGLQALQIIREKEKNVPFYGEYSDPEDPAQLGTTWSGLAYAHIIYAGYRNNQYVKNEPYNPFETFYNFVEDAGIEGDKEKTLSVLKPVLDCFTSMQSILINFLPVGIII